MTKLNRFNGWVAHLAFSCVVLGALVQDSEINFDRSSNDKYVISVCSISIALSFLSVCGYLVTEKLVGGIFEASIGTIVFALWCGAISLIMNPNNEIAIEQRGVFHVLRNTNLYFFSWASFISSAFILCSVAQQYRLVDVTAPTRLVRWYLFLIASVVVFGTGSKLKPVICTFEDDLCRTTKYAVSLGVVSAGLSLIPIIWSHLAKMYVWVEALVGIIVTVFYCVGAAYITDVSGPGSNIGNLYFATWFGFGLAVLLTFSCFSEMIAPDIVAEESQHPEVTKSGQQQEDGDHPTAGPQSGGQEQLEEVEVEGRDEEA